MIKLRYGDEMVGLLVIVATVVFLGIAFQAGVLSQWFRTTTTLRILLPETGSAGLSSGSDVEVLGTKAGDVRRVVINPDQQMYAEVDIEEQAKPFIRRDSVAVIRKRFGVAGAAYVDISRGKGENLDWNFAVIQGVTERDPTESIGTLIDQVRGKVFPLLDDLTRTSGGLADLVEGVKKGQGSIGRLLTDDTLMREAEETVKSVHESIARLGPIMDELQSATHDISTLARTTNIAAADVPALIKRTDHILVSLQDVMQELSKASGHIPQIAKNIEGGTGNLPSLLTQTEQTLHNLDDLIVQMRGSWLLGGGGGGGGTPATTPSRLPSTQVRP